MLYRITEMQVWLFSEVCRVQYSGEQVAVAISQGCVPVQSYWGIDLSRLSRASSATRLVGFGAKSQLPQFHWFGLGLRLTSSFPFQFLYGGIEGVG